MDEQLAFSIAVSTCIPSTKSLSLEEQENLITQLFNCKYPTYTPNKRAIFHKFDAEFLSNFFN